MSSMTHKAVGAMNRPAVRVSTPHFRPAGYPLGLWWYFTPMVLDI